MASPSIPRRLRCSSPGRHLDPCAARRPDDDEGDPQAPAPECRGCLPRQAAPGSQTCRACETRARSALADLPDLFADLAEKPRIQQSRAEASEDMDDAAGAPMEAGRVDARHAIRRALGRSVAFLAAVASLGVPDEEDAARASREAYARHSALASQARNLASLLEAPPIHRPSDGPFADLLAGDPRTAQVAREDAKRHLDLAQAAWDDRSTGRDVIRLRAVHVEKHLETLLAEPEAAELVVAIVSAQRLARSKANPSRDDRQRIVCSCGAWVTLDAEETMTCRTCGAWGVLSWWVEQVAPAVTDEPMTAQGILDWLLVRHGIGVVTHDDLRQWAVRHPDRVIRRGKNPRGEQTYEPSAGVVALAEKKRDRRIPRPRQESE